MNPASPNPATQQDTQPCQVVGIGASAGGLQALVRLLEHMPPAPGVALVVVLHLSSDYPSTADRLLQRATKMPVLQVTRSTPIRANHVYVISPGCSLAMQDGHLIVDELKRPMGDPTTIDAFLFTLARTHGKRAIGVILSGMGSDGVAGLTCIKEHGGVTIVQLPDDAEESAMPQAAIHSGAADFVLPAAQIPARLLEIRDISHLIDAQGLAAGSPNEAPPDGTGMLPQDALEQVLAVLHARTGHDFRHYKPQTILRRIERRLQVRGMPDLPAYHRLLEQDQEEPQALLKDLLIGVTGFFRDRQAFEALQRQVLPALFQERPSHGQVRVWVAACATGEEAYSLGMLLAEQAAVADAPAPFQVFASDIDERAIDCARAGVYPASIAADFDIERLQRYFTDEGDGYRVRKGLRNRILFAHHNLLQDPPFSRLDLVSCRNFLIYLTRDMYVRVLEMLHASLNAGGYLFLGSAESADMAPHLFERVDGTHRIYRALPAARTARRLSMVPSVHADQFLSEEGAAVIAGSGPSIAFVHQRALVSLAAPSVLVDSDGTIRHVADNAGPFLRYAGGEPTRDILALVLPELQLALRTALLRAVTTRTRAVFQPVLQGQQMVTVTVTPLPAAPGEESLLLVQFDQAPAAPRTAGVAHDGSDDGTARQLEEELEYAQHCLQKTVTEAQAANAGMRSAHEDLLGRLQESVASIEALETGQEELQSRNEELHTINAELSMRLAESGKAHDDLSNLIASTDIATLFLDRALHIKRFTPRVAAVINILPADIDRPLSHLTNRLNYPRLAEDAADVLALMLPREREVRSTDGRDYIVRMHPYRTGEDSVEGVVVTFFDITRRRSAEDALRDSEEQFRLFVTASSDTLYKMSADWTEMRDLQDMHFLASPESRGHTWLQRHVPPEDQPRVMDAIAQAIRNKSVFELVHRVVRADGAVTWVFSRAIPLLGADGAIVEWFGAASERAHGGDAAAVEDTQPEPGRAPLHE
jgi:two-component system CheB/CheR fusion protein